MARTKATPKPEALSNPSLSPPPTDDDGMVQMTANTKKRKAETAVKSTRRAKKTTVKKETNNGDDAGSADVVPQPKKRTTKVKVQEETVEDELKVEEGQNGETEIKKTVRKSRAKKKADLQPLEPRTIGSKLLVGAHVSIAGGVHNAISNLIHIGANAFAIFLKNQRKWDNPPLDPEHATFFISGCKEKNIDPGACCMPHGSYLVNLAHPDEERKKQAYGAFLDDLKRCHKLGIKLYNFHPGNCGATTREDGIALIAEHINNAHKDAETGEVITVLETMASLGNTIGGTFKDLGQIIELVENKDRVGVCLDTCHVFAAGYDLRTPNSFGEVMDKFDKEIGLGYLKAFHMNDSKAPLASHRDLHACIGTGYLGLRSFHNIVNDERLHGLPMVLETPIDVIDKDGKKIEAKSIWAREIKLLEKLVGMDVNSEEFKKLEKDLHEQGASERERIGDQVDRKMKKDAGEKVPKKGKGKGKKKVESDDGMDEDEE